MKENLLKIVTLCVVAMFMVGISNATPPDPSTITHQWTFEDGVALDIVGDAHGSLMGSASIVDGALVTSGVGSDESPFGWLEVSPLEINASSYSAMSVEVWFTIEDNAPTWQMIFYLGDSTDALGFNGYFIQPVRGDDRFRTAISVSEAEPWANESGANLIWERPEPTDTLFQIVSVITATEISLYVDGELIETGELAENNKIENIGGQLAWIGRGGYIGDASFHGKTHKVTMFNVALTDEEIATLYEHGTAPYLSVENSRFRFTPKVYAANGSIFVKNTSDAAISSIEVYNLVGKLVHQSNRYQEELRLNLAPSVYIVKVNSNLGSYATKVVTR